MPSPRTSGKVEWLLARIARWWRERTHREPVQVERLETTFKGMDLSAGSIGWPAAPTPACVSRDREDGLTPCYNGCEHAATYCPRCVSTAAHVAVEDRERKLSRAQDQIDELRRQLKCQLCSDGRAAVCSGCLDKIADAPSEQTVTALRAARLWVERLTATVGRLAAALAFARARVAELERENALLCERLEREEESRMSGAA